MPSDRQTRRLFRQIAALERTIPALRRPVHALLRGRWRWVRIPMSLLLIAGGLASFLPVLGIWMLPLGLLLLAVDLPPLRPLVSRLVIRGRRWVAVRLRRGRT